MMTLNRQLWAIIAAVVTIMFLCGVFISIASNVQQLNQQLTVKNNDNANLLAQMISELEKDPVLLELLISAQFDTGYYEYLRLRTLDGETNIIREFEGRATTSAPGWFLALIDVDPTPGIAHISDGWNQFGTIEVKSHSGYLTSEMWTSTVRFGFWSAIIAIILGVASTFLQRIVTKPLDKVIGQAEALGSKRFISLPVPKTQEYRRLVVAMNLLTRRVKNMLEKDNEKLNMLRAKTEQDESTGLSNRGIYLSHLEALLRGNDRSEEHGVIIIRVRKLDKLNKTFGRPQVDAFIFDLAQAMRAICKHNNHQFESHTTARLNGSDFSILLNQPSHLAEFSETVYEHIKSVCQNHNLPSQSVLVGSVSISADDSKAQVLMRIDSILSTLESEEASSNYLHSTETKNMPFLTSKDWRSALEKAITQRQVYFEFYPVLSLHQQEVMHYEGMMRAQFDDEVRNAGFFLPWARRLELIDAIELTALQSFFSDSKSSGMKVSIKLSFEFLSKEDNRAALINFAKLQKPEAEISIELHEVSLIEHPVAFELYCIELQKAGFKIGLQSALNCFTQLSNIHELGLDFIKLHATLTQGAHDSADGASVLKGFCHLGHSLSATVIAQGFKSEHDKKLLEELGVDGVTGPGVILS